MAERLRARYVGMDVEFESSGLTVLWGLLCLCCCSVTRSCPALCDPMYGSTPGLPVHHQLPELAQLLSIKSVMPSNHLNLCHPLLPPSIFPSIRVFSSEFFASSGQSIGVSASASVLPMNTQDWFPLRLTGWISFHFKGLSRVFSSTTVWKHQFFSTQPLSVQLSHPYMTIGKAIALTCRPLSAKWCLCL